MVTVQCRRLSCPALPEGERGCLPFACFPHAAPGGIARSPFCHWRGLHTLLCLAGCSVWSSSVMGWLLSGHSLFLASGETLQAFLPKGADPEDDVMTGQVSRHASIYEFWAYGTPI